jgi:predicted phage tail protein
MKTRIKFWLFGGVMLANLGLFLQPKNPAEFLVQAIFSPAATLASYGLQPALLFWSGIALLLVGAADRLLPRTRRSASSRPAAPNEFDDGWSFL